MVRGGLPCAACGASLRSILHEAGIAKRNSPTAVTRTKPTLKTLAFLPYGLKHSECLNINGLSQVVVVVVVSDACSTHWRGTWKSDWCSRQPRARLWRSSELLDKVQLVHQPLKVGTTGQRRTFASPSAFPSCTVNPLEARGQRQPLSNQLSIRTVMGQRYPNLCHCQ